MSFTYLAAPYWHESGLVKALRIDAVKVVSAKLLTEGPTFSPLIQGVNAISYLPSGANHEWWMNRMLPFVRLCNRLDVLMLPGWENSRGVTEEIFTATQLDIPIRYLEAEKVVPNGLLMLVKNAYEKY